MDLPQLFSIIMNLSTLVFVVTSMLAMGLSLSVAQILAPLRGMTVNPWDIARPLIFLMLLPLATALFVKAHYAQRAGSRKLSARC